MPSFEMKTTTIANSKLDGLLESSTLSSDGTTFCSLIVDFDGVTFHF
jgi:hypothetical protein